MYKRQSKYSEVLFLPRSRQYKINTCPISGWLTAVGASSSWQSYGIGDKNHLLPVNFDKGLPAWELIVEGIPGSLLIGPVQQTGLDEQILSHHPCSVVSVSG